jgi:hypothetical protein
MSPLLWAQYSRKPLGMPNWNVKVGCLGVDEPCVLAPDQQVTVVAIRRQFTALPQFIPGDLTLHSPKSYKLISARNLPSGGKENNHVAGLDFISHWWPANSPSYLASRGVHVIGYRCFFKGRIVPEVPRPPKLQGAPVDCDVKVAHDRSSHSTTYRVQTCRSDLISDGERMNLPERAH